MYPVPAAPDSSSTGLVNHTSIAPHRNYLRAPSSGLSLFKTLFVSPLSEISSARPQRGLRLGLPMFRELADGIVSRLRQMLENLRLDATELQVNLMHSLSVGLAVVDPATQRPHSKRRVEAILESLFATLASKDRKE
jgi:hypothetical protein